MSKYIGTPVVNISADTVDVTGDITTTDTTPEVIIVNNTHEDTDGGREGKVTFKGQQSGGEETTLAQIQASHDGTSDDEKGDLIFKTNDGSDGASPTEAMRITSDQRVGIGETAPATNLHISSTANPAISIEDTDNGFAATTLQVENGGRDLDITVPQDIIFTSGSDEAMRILSGGNVGIGDTAPDRHLHVNGGTENVVAKFESTDTACSVEFTDSTGTVTLETRNDFRFKTGSNIDMMIDSSGNVLVGKSATDSGTTGVEALPQGTVYITGSTLPFYINRTSGSELARFAINGTTVGQLINEQASSLTVSSNGTGYLGLSGVREYSWDTAQFYPVNDNQNDLGFSSFRWDDVRATNGTIQTSDENDKEQIASLTDAEITAAKAISKLFKTFKWRDKVEAKGDAARTHAGVIAQQVQTAMSDAGLDVTKYAFWCSDTWWQTETEVPAIEADEENDIVARAAYTDVQVFNTAEEAPEDAVQKTRLGIRYPELLSFIGAATEQRLTSIEARLDALEGA